jgi:ATP-dependent DNA helicase RecG
MNEAQLIALVDRLRALPSETEWVEFKRDNTNPQLIGEYLSALANEACLRQQARGYLVFGIDDDTHDVVGTGFDPYTHKAKGNQDLLPWLGALLSPNTGVEPWVIAHPEGRVVMLAVGPARNQPVSFAGKAYGRTGASKVELTNHPEKQRALWMRGTDWSAEVCDGATLDDLDPDALTKAREQFQTKHPAQAAEISAWDLQTFLNKAKLLRQGAVTNTALVLLGRGEAASLISPSVAKVSWVLKDATTASSTTSTLGRRYYWPVIDCFVEFAT